MEIIAFVVLLLFSLAGLLAIFFTNFGTFLILLGALFFAMLTGFTVITAKWLVWLLILYLAGEALDYVFIIAATKRFGGSNLAILGAMAGGILAALFVPGLLGIGVILAAFLGIFLGACVVELLLHKDVRRALKAATGSVLGHGASIMAKVVIAVIMFIIIGYALVKR